MNANLILAVVAGLTGAGVRYWRCWYGEGVCWWKEDQRGFISLTDVRG